jgi:hypothetical protein
MAVKSWHLVDQHCKHVLGVLHSCEWLGGGATQAVDFPDAWTLAKEGKVANSPQ